MYLVFTRMPVKLPVFVVVFRALTTSLVCWYQKQGNNQTRTKRQREEKRLFPLVPFIARCNQNGTLNTHSLF